MALPFTDRELRNAWRNLLHAAELCSSVSDNSKRLLLYYAVECGLKAVWLKRQGKSVFGASDVQGVGHDICKLAKEFHVSHDSRSLSEIKLSSVKENKGLTSRNCGIKELHQAWRYGGVCESPNDSECEKELLKLKKWIEQELK